MHESKEGWGTTGQRFAPVIRNLYEKYACKDILDYGAGKESVKKSLPDLKVKSYEPSNPQLSKSPNPRDLVCCLDVLEHVEPEYLDNVLDDLRRVTKKVGLFVVSTVPAIQKLPDGRNAHLIVEQAEFWLPKLIERFEIQFFQRQQNEFMVVVC